MLVTNVPLVKTCYTHLDFFKIKFTLEIFPLYTKQAGADITGQLQVGPMLYTLYIDINVRVVKMLHPYNKQQITK